MDDIKELEHRIRDLTARTQFAELVANKAFDVANQALVKVAAMEKSTHKAYFLNPGDLSDPTAQAVASTGEQVPVTSLFEGLTDGDIMDTNGLDLEMTMSDTGEDIGKLKR